MPNTTLYSFNNGEVTPQIDARSDVEKYLSSCRIMENMLPRIYGSAERRPGTKYINTTKNSPEGVQLIPFIYSAEIAYMCEFGNQYIRFYYDGAILNDDAGDPVEVATPYLVADLPQLQTVQLGDTMWIVHSGYAPRKLTRTTVTSFSLDEITFEKGPFLTRNDIANDDDVTMASDVTAVDDTGTLTASGPTFTAEHAGALWKVIHPRADLEVTQEGEGTSDALDVKGTYSFVTTGAWKGTVRLQRNEDSKGWEDSKVFTGLTVGARNVRVDSTEDEDNVQYRVVADSGMSAAFGATLTTFNAYREGIVRIDAVASAYVAGITVLTAIDSTDTTVRWAEGAWSGHRGYPAAIGFYEDRIVYGGTSNNSQTVWLSETDDYENFEEGVNDADSFSVVLTTTNDIRWLQASDALLVGTSGDEWAIASNKIGTALTPTNFSAKQHSTHGAKALQAVRIREAVLFVDYVGRKVREMTYSINQEKYVAPDLASLAEHITEGGINCIAYQRNPDSILWAVRGDGTLLSMSYEREQNVVAWARHLIGLTQEETTSASYYANALSNYEMLYINDNDHVWGIPANWDTGTTLHISGEAREVASGIVGIPCVGHPFKDGQTIRINGSTHYDDEYELIAATSPDELVFADTFSAETFAGTETVVQVIDVDSGIGRMAQDADGVLYVGHTEDDDKCVVKITDGSVEDDDFFTPTGGWNNLEVVTGIAISSDDAYLYVHTDDKRLIKFATADGSEVWNVSTGASSACKGYDIALDSSDNVYIPGCADDSGKGIAGFSASDGTKLNYTHAVGSTTVHSHYAIAADSDIEYTSGHGGVVLEGSVQEAFTSQNETLYNLLIRDIDNHDGKEIALGGVYVDGSRDKTYLIRTGCVITYDGYIYVLVSNGKLYKLNTNLEIMESIDAPAYAVGLFADFWGHIVVVNQGWSEHQSTIFYLYDADLNAEGSIGGLHNLMLGTWAAAVGGAYIQGNACFWPGIFPRYIESTTSREATGTVESVAVIPGDEEDEVWVSVLRSVNGSTARYIERLQPRVFDTQADCFFVDCGLLYDGDATSTFSGLDHLEGETVAVLGDGAVFPTERVIGGTITIPNSISQASIGLPFQYRLKPMRLDITTRDGSSKGSYKKISELVISFLDTLNAECGVSADTSFPINWRTTEVYDSPPDLYTGDQIVTHDAGFDPEDPIMISGRDPLPCTVRSITARQKATGR